MLGGLAEDVPEGDIDGGDGDHAYALATEGHRLAVHVLPEEFDIPGVSTDEEGLEVEIDDLFGNLWREGGVADADDAGVGFDFADEPAVEGESTHGVRISGCSNSGLNLIHGIGAEMRRERDGFAAPFNDTGTDIGNFHARTFAGTRTSKSREASMASGTMRRTPNRINMKAMTWSRPATARMGA